MPHTSNSLSLSCLMKRFGIGIDRPLELAEGEKEEFKAQCIRLTCSGLYLTAVTISAGTIATWPIDFFTFRANTGDMWLMHSFRSILVLLSLATLISLKSSRALSAHSAAVGLVAFTIASGSAGWITSELGGFATPFAYGFHSAPMLTIILFLELRFRIASTLWLMVVFYSCFFLATPEELSRRFAEVPIIWSACAMFASVAVGHLTFLVLRTNFIQRRRLDDLSRNLQTRVMEQTEKIRQLTAAIFNVQEEERARISHDLHDELGQMLLRLGMEIEWMQRMKKTKELSTSFEESLNVLQGLTQRIHEALDVVLGDLRPAGLDRNDFDIALTAMIEKMAERNGLMVEISFDTDIESLSITSKTALYRIVQEAMTNIVKHAHATSASVSFSYEEDCTVLRIQDNGVGFDPEAVDSKNRLGLKGLQERSRLLDGKLRIRGTQGEGTEIEIVFPSKCLEERGLP